MSSALAFAASVLLWHGMSAPAHIWVIDDEQDVVDATTLHLDAAGYRTTGFTDPRESVAALDAGELPDLVLLDLNMPYMTGTEWLRELRKRPEGQLTPVLVVTALGTESSVLNAIDSGADDVLRKPVSITELLGRIRGHLRRSRSLTVLRQENADLVLLHELASALGEETDLPEVLRTLIDGLRRALNVDLAAFYLLDETSGQLHRALPSDPSRAEGAPNISLELRHLPEVASSLAARRVAILDASKIAAFQQAVGGVSAKITSAAVFPMHHQGAMLGVIAIAAGRPHVGATTRDHAFTTVIASLAAVAVKRADLFRSLREEHFASARAARELQKTRDFLENVILSSPDAIVASNRDGNIILYNNAAERILGWSRSEAIGMDVRALYPHGGAGRIMQMMLANGGRLEPMREVVCDHNGVKIPVEISAAIVREQDGRMSAAVGIFTDLRGRIQMEEQLQEATESLERSQQQAMLAELAGAAAHELNQPLTSLLAYAELLARRTEPEDPAGRAVRAIQQEAERIADIVKKIGEITEYRTKEYVGGARIVDLNISPEGTED